MPVAGDLNRQRNQAGSRMRDRRGLAILILSVWVVALGWQARRVFFPSELERLAAGVRTLPPGVAYYGVFRGDLRAGWAQVEIDTLPSGGGFLVRDRLFLEIPGLGATGRVEQATEEFLGTGLDLDSLTRLSVAGVDTTRVRAVVEGDSLILIVTADGTREEVPLTVPVTTESGWRLRLAASGLAREGARYGLDLFDAPTATRRSAEIEVLEAGARSFPDSADTDSLSGAWVVVREDTVQAWRVRRRVGESALESWVDEDGRLVDGEIAGGFRLVRTAFELAFFTRPGADASPAGTPGEESKRGGE